MMARSLTVEDLPYSRLLHEPDDDEYMALEELKPVSVQNLALQQNSSGYQPSYYELSNSNMLERCASSAPIYPTIHQTMDSSNSSLLETQNEDLPNNTSRKRKGSYYNSSVYLTQHATMDSSNSSQLERHNMDSPIHTRGKRKASFHETSDFEDDTADDSKSVKTIDENKKQNHSEIEKRRRDKMNTYITELSSMIPLCNAMSRKLDKLTVLRMAVQHLKTIRGAVNSYTEGHYKPTFLSDQELKHLILQAVDGFLFVVGCDRGRILYVSESVSKVLNYSQGELLGQSLFDILHPKDVAKLKEQLTSSDLSPRERLIDAKTMLPVKTDVPQGATRLCPGARRSFFCRMKCKLSTQVKEEADTTTGSHRRTNKQNADKKYSVIQCTGYLKSWATAKMGIEEQEGEADSCNVSCLVAIGRILPNIGGASNNSSPNLRTIQFESRHALDGKFLFVDPRFTLALGFTPQELLGTSMYEYYHQNDIHTLAEYHKVALQNLERVNTKIYRFRTKDSGFIRLQTEWKCFKNPWTKDIEYLLARNNLILSDLRAVESTGGRHETNQREAAYELFTQGGDKNIQRKISNHVELSKIGRQIAEQVVDSHRRIESSPDGSSPTTDPESSLPPPSADESHISTSRPMGATNEPLNHDFSSSTQYNHVIRDSVLCTIASGSNAETPIAPEEVGMIGMMDDAVRETPNNNPSTDGNDEAAMAVIMSLLEADAGLGGPVDFSGLPWPLP